MVRESSRRARACGNKVATIYLDLFGRLDRFYHPLKREPIALPYIAVWHRAPGKLKASPGP